MITSLPERWRVQSEHAVDPRSFLLPGSRPLCRSPGPQNLPRQAQNAEKVTRRDLCIRLGLRLGPGSSVFGNLLWNGLLTWSGIRRTTPRPADGSPQTVHADWTTEAPNAPGASAPSRGRHTAGTHGTRGTRERRSPWEAPGTGEGSAP